MPPSSPSFRPPAISNVSALSAINHRAIGMGTVLVLVYFLANISCTQATPETWIAPSFTATGNGAGRFGAALACSDASGSPAQSYVAIGAPLETSGAGKVYIYNPNDTTSPLQTITSPSSGANKHFGSSVAFINDGNSDGRKELAIGEPNESGGNGAVYIYYSTGNPAAPFTLCGSNTNSQGFGGALLGLKNTGGHPSQVVVGAPESGATLSFNIIQIGASCVMTDANQFDSLGGASSRWGQSVSEIAQGATSDILVGAPDESSSAGVVASVDSSNSSTTRYTGASGERLGLSVASDPDNSLFAITSANAASVAVKRNNLGAYSDWCTITLAMNDIPASAGRSAAHLKSAFSTLIGISTSPLASFAAYQTETETGGSVALFGAQALNSCSAIKQVNNCQLDTTQEQGFAIGGGEDCKINLSGNSRSLFMVGSPGASGDGRVDFYVEGTELGAAQGCAAPTPTMTPTSTATSTPTETPPTSAPIQTPTIEVVPGSKNLPPPEVTVLNQKQVKITFPVVTLGSDFVKRVAKILKISTRRAAAIRPTISYVANIFVVKSRQSSTSAPAISMMSAPVSPQLEAQSSSRRIATITSRKNSVTLSRLSPGQIYKANYYVELQIKKPKATLKTQTSPSTTFRLSLPGKS